MLHFSSEIDDILRAPSAKTICESLPLYIQVILSTMHGKDTAIEEFVRIFSNIHDGVFWRKQSTGSS